MKLKKLAEKIGKKPEKRSRSNDGVLIIELEKNEGCSLAHGELLPGEKSKKHVMEMQEIYYFLEGKGIINIDEETEQVKKDVMVVVPKGAIQSVKNTGKKPLRFLCIVSPPYDSTKERILE